MIPQPVTYVIYLFLLLVLIPTQLLAYSFTPEIGIDVRQESNVTKDLTDTEDTVTAPYLGFNFRETNATINTNINFLATYEDYKDNTFSSKDLYEVNAFLDWSLMPERLVWAFEDYAKTQRVDILNTDIPDNLETVNVFSTGPDLIFQHTVWTALAKLRYGASDFSTSSADTTFYSLTGAIRREINEYSRLTTALAFRQTDYDETVLDDYDLYKAYIRYSRDLPTGDFLADVGFNSVEFDSNIEEDEPYFNLLMSIQPTGATTLDLSLVDEITDAAGRAYTATESRVVDETEDQFTKLGDFTSTGVSRSRYASLGLRYEAGGLFSWGLSGSYAEQEYFDNTVDSSDVAGRLYANLLLTDRLSFGIAGLYQEVDYDASAASPEITDEITSGVATLSYRITDNISSRLGYSSEERTSTDIIRDFTDDIVFFSLNYRGAVKQ